MSIFEVLLLRNLFELWLFEFRDKCCEVDSCKFESCELESREFGEFCVFTGLDVFGLDELEELLEDVVLTESDEYDFVVEF